MQNLGILVSKMRELWPKYCLGPVYVGRENRTKVRFHQGGAFRVNYISIWVLPLSKIWVFKDGK